MSDGEPVELQHRQRGTTPALLVDEYQAGADDVQQRRAVAKIKADGDLIEVDTAADRVSEVSDEHADLIIDIIGGGQR